MTSLGHTGNPVKWNNTLGIFTRHLCRFPHQLGLFRHNPRKPMVDLSGVVPKSALRLFVDHLFMWKDMGVLCLIYGTIMGAGFAIRFLGGVVGDWVLFDTLTSLPSLGLILAICSVGGLLGCIRDFLVFGQDPDFAKWRMYALEFLKRVMRPYLFCLAGWLADLALCWVVGALFGPGPVAFVLQTLLLLPFATLFIPFNLLLFVMAMDHKMLPILEVVRKSVREYRRNFLAYMVTFALLAVVAGAVALVGYLVTSLAMGWFGIYGGGLVGTLVLCVPVGFVFVIGVLAFYGLYLDLQSVDS